MSRFKISQLYIKNFKCFTEITFNFEGNSLIVFDGPNGYGKTTAFEAIEILLTKTPRKINKVNLDKRYTYRNSPIHKDEDEQIEICAWFQNETEIELVLKRVFPAASGSYSKKNNISQIFTDSKLYVGEQEISDEKELENYLGYENLKSLFNVLNYVEQDENTYFLKEDPKERYKALISLLGGNEERILHDKTEVFIRKLTEKIGQLGTAIQDIKSRNSEILEANLTEMVFEKLLDSPDQLFPWDSHHINNANLEINNSYINEVKKIETLYDQKAQLGNVISLKKINDFLNSSTFIQVLVERYWSVINFETLQKEDDQRTVNLTRFSNNERLKGFIQSLEFATLLQDAHFDFLATNVEIAGIDFPAFKSHLTRLSTLKDSLSAQNQVLAELKTKREQLLQLFRQHKHQTSLEEGACPACGYDWKTDDELIKQLTETAEKIFASYNVQNNSYEIQKKELEDNFLTPFKDFLQQDNLSLQTMNGRLFDRTLFTRLKDQYGPLSSQFSTFLSLFSADKVAEILTQIDHRAIGDLQNAISVVANIINQSKPIVDISIDVNELVTDLNRYFGGNYNLLESLSKEKFAEKIRYINFQFFNAINNDLKVLEGRKNKLEGLKTEITTISGEINNKIRTYTSNIVEKISIPFYIYTGKILQNHSLGSGLVLRLDIGRESQIYIRPKYRDQEVTYTLSSGQLSATVISLMLVLNKVFDQSKLGTIFIDDPLQTLDEINSHSLVELLKYNFSQKQILLSTHEDRYSQFIQYKFNKFNLSNKSIRLKEII